eukprot:SM000154S01389  [mRNA]  locus=s154:154214:158558:+ [translate_table: standard]
MAAEAAAPGRSGGVLLGTPELLRPQPPERTGPPRRRRRAAGGAPPMWLALLAALLPSLLLLLGRRADAQMLQPFAGQGTPPAGTQAHPVFVSVFLERLLHVNGVLLLDQLAPSLRLCWDVPLLLRVMADVSYSFEAIFYMVLSWSDSRAPAELARRTAEVEAGGKACRRFCGQDFAPCCDTVWLPGTSIRNIIELPQGRVETEGISLGGRGNDSLSWEKRIHGVFYTDYSFKAFPYDKQSLIVYVTLDVLPVGSLHGSSTATRFGLSHSNATAWTRHYDELSGWSVKALRFTLETLDNQVFTKFATKPNPADPYPYGPGNASQPGIQFSHDVLVLEIQMLFPLFLTTMLSWVTFCIHPEELAARLGTSVTFFLALTALQFVIDGQLPSSSYLTTLHLLILISYIAISVGTCESVLVFALWNKYVRARAKKVDEEDRAGLSGPSLAALKGLGSGSSSGASKQSFQEVPTDDCNNTKQEQGAVDSVAAAEGAQPGPPYGKVKCHAKPPLRRRSLVHTLAKTASLAPVRVVQGAISRSLSWSRWRSWRNMEEASRATYRLDLVFLLVLPVAYIISSWIIIRSSKH